MIIFNKCPTDYFQDTDAKLKSLLKKDVDYKNFDKQEFYAVDMVDPSQRKYILNELNNLNWLRIEANSINMHLSAQGQILMNQKFTNFYRKLSD